VKEALSRGVEVLPIVMVDDRIVVEGSYPSRETLAALAGVVVRKLELAAPAAGGCCTPSTDKSKPSCC
jgi:predicted DsbA family dithiol-disulfide isomerase